jgi:hypothetical protein
MAWPKLYPIINSCDSKYKHYKFASIFLTNTAMHGNDLYRFKVARFQRFQTYIYYSDFIKL